MFTEIIKSFWYHILISSSLSFPFQLCVLEISYCCDDRTEEDGEVGNQNMHRLGILPKFPGRFYYYFGKPIETEGMFIGHHLYLNPRMHSINSINHCDQFQGPSSLW